MRAALPILAITAAALAYATPQACAQENTPDKLPGQGASPTTSDSSDPQDVGVEVSLGREEVKQQLAAELGVSEAELPLSVYLPIAIAERVCGQAEFDARANANRSCTATTYVPEIAQVVRDHPQTSAVPEQ